MKSKTRELIIIIQELSENQTILSTEKNMEKYIDRFSELYCDGYRHQYSYIYIELNKLRKREPESLQILNQNIKIISDKINSDDKEILLLKGNNEDESKEEFSKSILKLYDHISLDIARFDEIARLERELNISERKAEDMKEDIEKIIPELNKSQQELVDSKNQYVSILGIFASIVIGFFANLAFGASVLENIDSINIYRLLLVTVIVGWVMTISLSILLKFIHQTLKTTEIKFYNSENNNEKLDDSSDISKISKDRYLVDIKEINKVFFCITIATIVAWLIDIVSLRHVLVSKLIHKLSTLK